MVRRGAERPSTQNRSYHNRMQSVKVCRATCQGPIEMSHCERPKWRHTGKVETGLRTPRASVAHAKLNRYIKSTSRPGKSVRIGSLLPNSLIQERALIMANQVGNGPLSSDEAEILSTDAPTALDPRLQRLVARRLYGAIERPATSTGQDEVAVIAKVTDRDAWEGLSEVRVGGTVGDAGEDGTLIVTARIPVTRIEYLRQQPFVRSLKATQPLQPTLNRTIAETGAIAALLPAGNQSDGAAGVVVGIVDFGFDFVHRNFRIGVCT